MPSASLPKTTADQLTLAMPDPGRPSRVRSLLGLPAPTPAPPRLPMALPISLALPLPSHTIADNALRELPEDEPVTPPMSSATRPPGELPMATPPPVAAQTPAQEQGQVNHPPPAGLPRHAALDEVVAARPTVEAVTEPPTRRAEDLSPISTSAIAPRPMIKQSVPVELPTTTARPEAVIMAIPGTSRGADKPPQQGAASLQPPPMPTVAAPATASSDDGHTAQRQAVAASPLPPVSQLASHAASTAVLPQASVSQASPPLQSAQASHVINRATPEPTASNLLREPATQPRTVPPVSLPQLASTDQRAGPSRTSVVAQGEERRDQAAWAQIEQLRRTVQGLQAKVASQPVAEQAPPPAPAQPPPRPVIIKRTAPPVPTLSAFWERRHLGRSHLRLLR